MSIIQTQECSAHSSLQIEVPRQTSWHVPRGSFPATIRSINEVNRFAGHSASRVGRFIFTVHVPNADLDYLAKLELRLDLNEGSELWNLICRLASREVLQQRSGQTFDLKSLEGMKCDIEIDHNYDRAEDYDFPLVIVTDVQEEGGLIKPAIVKGA